MGLINVWVRGMGGLVGGLGNNCLGSIAGLSFQGHARAVCEWMVEDIHAQKRKKNGAQLRKYLINVIKAH